MNIATILAILCLTALGIVAMANNINGMLLAGIGTLIGGLGGFSIKRKVEKNGKDKNPPS